MGSGSGRPRNVPQVPELTCYFDESFSDSVHVVAGYVASTETWDGPFTVAWNSALRDRSRPVSEFKASDCRQGRGDFRGWERAEREDLVFDLSDVLLMNPIAAGFATAVVFPGEFRGRRDRALMNQISHGMALGMCLYQCLRTAVPFCERSLRVVVDAREGFYDRVLRNFEGAKGTLEAEHARKISGPFSGDSKDCPALQAADLLAYETHREVVGRQQRGTVSTTLERLALGIAHVAICVYVKDPHEYNRQAAAGQRPKFEGEVLFAAKKAIRTPGNWLIPPE